jgi:hypothetical protein
MSEGDEVVQIQLGTDAAFSDLMDALVEDEGAEAGSATTEPPAGERAAADEPATPARNVAGSTDSTTGDAGTGAAAAGTGASPSPGAGATDTDAARPADTRGAGSSGTAEATGPDGGDGTHPGSSLTYDTIAPDLNQLGSKFEEQTTQSFQQAALDEVKQDYSKFFDALNTHPRLLIGTEVPNLQAEEGSETLRTTEDAKEWQEAVKSLLLNEVRDRAQKSVEENRQMLDTVHASIEIFTKNKDLVPGTAGFNRALADRFAAMAKPYELRVDGKLHGYTIPVQPLIEQLRTQIQSESGPASTSPPDKRPGRPPGSKNKPKPDPPQQGITSKAGSESSAPEDYSTLFGTLGLPNLRI